MGIQRETSGQGAGLVLVALDLTRCWLSSCSLAGKEAGRGISQRRGYLSFVSRDGKEGMGESREERGNPAKQ